MNNSSTNVIKLPKLGRIPASSIALLHQLAATWSLDEPAPLIVVFGVTDEQEDWCMFLDGLTDEPRYSFWKDGKTLHFANFHAPVGPHDETRVRNVPVTSAPYLVKLIELIDPLTTKRKANE